MTGLPPAHVPGRPASVFPVCAAPTIVGGELPAGEPPGYVPIATVAGSGPWKRSPSLQCAKPGTLTQSVHCQNVQLSPAQLAAGTSGAAPAVQCATQSGWPALATLCVSASAVFQKLGELYTSAATPVRASTSSSQAFVHVSSAVGERPPFVSRSSTGGSSPASGCATFRK